MNRFGDDHSSFPTAINRRAGWRAFVGEVFEVSPTNIMFPQLLLNALEVASLRVAVGKWGIKVKDQKKEGFRDIKTS